MRAFEQTRKLDALQPPYSLFRRDIEQEILPYTREHSIGVLVYGPLAHGLLAGTFTPQTTFAADDWRNKSEIFHGGIFQRNLAVVEQLKYLAEQDEMTVAQLAIAWVLPSQRLMWPLSEHATLNSSNKPPRQGIFISLKQNCRRSSVSCARRSL